jgi:hypothetical protein
MALGGATIAVSAQQCELAAHTVWGAVKAYWQGGWPAVKKWLTGNDDKIAVFYLRVTRRN